MCHARRKPALTGAALLDILFEGRGFRAAIALLDAGLIDAAKHALSAVEAPGFSPGETG